ncbi:MULTISPECIES: histidine kinase [unclassified Arcicella]|nr:MULTISPECIES: histidine kinase [unclassified Arcicella]MDR6560439.1 LytS/YehU family sensor histidine kinase [Arcicella sp. BE51]MDR6809955.1 LytS/YehU family sensor histidine kinase [Arcicella sp. BE140]
MRKTSSHIIFWIAYAFYFFLSGFITIPQKFAQSHNMIQNVVISVSEIIICFYLLIHRILPFTLPTKRYRILFFLLITLATLSSLGNAFFVYLYSHFITNNTFSFYKSCTVGLNNVYLSIHFALAYWFATNFVQNVREQSKAELQKSILEKSILEAELSSLKNQINPHFFYNSLNFLYAQALPVSRRLSDSVMLLSEMMRYTIKENDAEGKVPLEQEVKYIQNYFAIQQMQFGENLQLQIDIIGNINYRRIHPLTLSPFIENALKNGDLSSAEQPIKVLIETQENDLFLTIIYLRKKGIKESEVYDDLIEIRRKLYIVYFNNHVVKFEHSENIHKIFLKLSL